MPLPPFETHVVQNQPQPFMDRDLWRDDEILREAVLREGAAAFVEGLAAYGALAGGELYQLGFEANRQRPQLRTHDAQGNRIDSVDFHPAYHRLMHHGKAQGVAGLSWQSAQPGAHVARAALSYLHHQAEAGTSCPLTMTHAAVPVLRQSPALAGWARKAAAPVYDPRDVPVSDKAGITVGMGMTEKQGGSDVRANTTTATPLATSGEYRLVGHKWFFSAPMSDGWLVLAQAPDGLSCFLMPRRLPCGRRNDFRLMRLKDKLGDWANASSEVEFCGAWAQRVGEEGRGIATIIEMVMLTRLDCMLGSAAQMRMALAQALHYARHRRSFGQRLVEHPLMANVLADLALESEAATTFALRVAHAVDAAALDPREAAFVRIATALGKFWICKRAPGFINEAQECLGGAGYIEESMLPRLYRQAARSSVWVVRGNLQCLDVLRALQREPATGKALLDELERVQGSDELYDTAFANARRMLESAEIGEGMARRLCAVLATLLQAAALLRAGSPVARTFIRTRLRTELAMACYGTLSDQPAWADMLARALPAD